MSSPLSSSHVDLHKSEREESQRMISELFKSSSSNDPISKPVKSRKRPSGRISRGDDGKPPMLECQVDTTSEEKDGEVKNIWKEEDKMMDICDYGKCCVAGCNSSTDEIQKWLATYCNRHLAIHAICPCSKAQPYYMYSMRRNDPLRETLLLEMAADDETLIKLCFGGRNALDEDLCICSAHFSNLMCSHNQIIPLLGLRKTPYRIRMILRKYNLEHILPVRYDTPQFSKTPKYGVYTIKLPLESSEYSIERPNFIKSGEEYRYLIFSNEDFYFANYFPLDKKKSQRQRDYENRRRRIDPSTTLSAEYLEVHDLYEKCENKIEPDEYRSDSIANLSLVISNEKNLESQQSDIRKIIKSLEDKHCSVIEIPSWASKLGARCSVFACPNAQIYDERSHHYSGLNPIFFSSLPADICSALEWIYVSKASIRAQFDTMRWFIGQWQSSIGFFSRISKEDSRVEQLELLKGLFNSDLLNDFVKSFPHMLCDQHFEYNDDSTTDIVPSFMLPSRTQLKSLLLEKSEGEVINHMFQALSALEIFLPRKLNFMLNNGFVPEQIEEQQKELFEKTKRKKNVVDIVDAPDDKSYLWKTRAVHRQSNSTSIQASISEGNVRVPRRCIVRSCPSCETTLLNNRLLRFIPLPVKAPLRNIWLNMLHRGDSLFFKYARPDIRERISSYSEYICELHFIEKRIDPFTGVIERLFDKGPCVNLKPGDAARGTEGNKLSRVDPCEKRCCQELYALQQQLIQAKNKATVLWTLINKLQILYGLQIHPMDKFDDSDDDAMMYKGTTEFSSVRKLDVADALAGLQETLEDEKKEMQLLAEQCFVTDKNGVNPDYSSMTLEQLLD